MQHLPPACFHVTTSTHIPLCHPSLQLGFVCVCTSGTLRSSHQTRPLLPAASSSSLLPFSAANPDPHAFPHCISCLWVCRERGPSNPPPSNAANTASSYFPQPASGPDPPAIPFLYFRFVCVQTEVPSGPSHQMQLMLPATSFPTPTPKPASMSQYQP